MTVCPACRRSNDDAVAVCVCGRALRVPMTATVTRAPRDLVIESHAPRYGAFDVVAQLGAGGMGVVYRAIDSRLGRVVALKVLPESVAREPGARARFEREARIVSRLEHPFIAPLLEFGQHEGALYFAMPLYEGESLQQRIARGPVPMGEALVFLEQIARALEAAHAAGVVHRDLKPSNVMLVPEVGVKLLDFGIASASVGDAQQVPLTQTGDVVGTVQYMAPEQLRGERIEPRIDLWALGVVAYELVSGRPPFTGATSAEVIGAILAASPVDLALVAPDAPAALVRLVHRLLAKSAHARPADARAVADTLRALHEPSAAPTVAPAATTKRRRWPRVVALALCAAASATAATWWWTQESPAPTAALLAPSPSSALPARERRVAIVADTHALGVAPWMAPAVSALATRRLRAEALRFDVPEARSRRSPSGGLPANVVVRLVAEPEGAEGVVLHAHVGPSAEASTLFRRAHGDSVAAAFEALVSPLRDHLSADQPEFMDAALGEEMKRVGARSLPAYRLWRRAHDHYRTAFTDHARVVAWLDEAIRLDPAWLRPRAWLTQALGVTAPAAGKLLDMAALDAPARARDLSGALTLEASRLLAAQRASALPPLLRPHFDQGARDPAFLVCLGLSYVARGARDDAVGVMRAAHEAWPDLQFGADLGLALRHRGNVEAAQRLALGWFAAHPEAEQALVGAISVELAAKRHDDALALGDAFLRIYGREPHRLLVYVDALLRAERPARARPLIDRIVASKGLVRAWGLQRAAFSDLLEGRFGSAYTSLQEAVNAGRPFGLEGHPTWALALLRDLAKVTGQLGAERTHKRELALGLRAQGSLGAALAEEALLALDAAPASCPDTRALTARLETPGEREHLHRHLTRALAMRGCATCADVVRAGVSTAEESTASLVDFAECARREGVPALAERALRTAAELTLPTHLDTMAHASVLWVFVARTRLAQLLAETGRRDEALALFASVEQRWRNADRPLPILEEARRGLRQLRTR